MATDSPTGQENKRSLYCISNFFVNLRLFHVCFKLKQQNKTRINCIAFRNVIVFETHFWGLLLSTLLVCHPPRIVCVPKPMDSKVFPSYSILLEIEVKFLVNLNLSAQDLLNIIFSLK